MRERESCSPIDNRAVCTITPTYYDRRALDTQADYALCSSLAYLADLAQQSPKIRESLACDGGLEQIIRILKRGKIKRLPDRWQLVKWQSALLCVFNIGVRGSEFVRTRVVEAEMIPVVVTVLCQTLEKLERAQQYARYLASQQRYTVRQGEDRRVNHGVSITPGSVRSHAAQGTATPVSRSTTPATSGPDEPRDEIVTPPPFTRPDRLGARSDGTTTSVAAAASETPVELTRHMSEMTISTANAAAAAAAAIDASRPMGSASSGSQVNAGRVRSQAGAIGLVGTSRAPETSRERLLRQAWTESDANESDDRLSAADELTTADEAAASSGLVHEHDVHTSSVTRHGLGLELDSAPPAAVAAAVSDVVHSGDGTLAAPEDAVLTELALPTAGHAAETIDAVPLRSVGTRPLSMPAGPGVPAGQLPKDLVVPTHLDSDVVMCLKLLAYLSKYPSLREAFQRSYDVPMLKQNLKQYDYFCSMDRPAGPFEPMDEDLSDELQMPFNVFQLVERFTARPPDEAAYWAGVTMRNSCRKDESRGGVRQCAYLECGKWEQSNRQFAKCRRCRRTKYCSKQCQSNAWPGHKWWCSASRDQADIASSSAAVGNATTSTSGGVTILTAAETGRLRPS